MWRTHSRAKVKKNGLFIRNLSSLLFRVIPQSGVWGIRECTHTISPSDAERCTAIDRCSAQ